MSSKDKKEKTDKKEKSDKKEKTDKKEKSDKSEKKDKPDKKDKADKSDKKEKSDKKDKSEKDKSDKSKEKSKEKDNKEKDNKSKEKDATKEKDAKPTAKKPTSDDEQKISGATTYARVKVKEDKAAKLKAGVVWIPLGKSITDRNFVWQEVATPNGEINYVLLADPDNVKYELPDIGGVAQEVVLEKKKFEEKKEWKDEAAKKQVLNAVKKYLSAEPRFAELSKDEQSTMTSNISKEFMSLYKKLDVGSEGWIQDQSQSQVSDFLNAKKAAQRSNERALAAVNAVQLKPTEPLSGELPDDNDLPLPSVPLASDKCPLPSSPLLVKASYLRDPYYHRRIHIRSARRVLYESKLEQTTFLIPGGGDIKVLCAMGVKTGKDFSKTLIYAVARDWVGAFNFFVMEASDTSDPSVIGAYPILHHVDFPAVGYQKVAFQIDENVFSATFRDQEHAQWLHDALKMAMCAMYGNGSDDERITSMRAYSVEFAASDVSYFPGGVIPDVHGVSRFILNGEKTGEALDPDFALLRLCMRTSEGRDSALRSWCRSIDESSMFKRKSAAMVSNHIRFLQEAVRSPCVHDDNTIPDDVLEHIELLKIDQPDPIVHELTKLRTMWRLQTPVMDRWVPRGERKDVPFEDCFSPEAGTQAERQEKMLIVQKRAQASSFINPPGIYLTLLCYNGSQVLCQSGSGTLFSEMIVPQPTSDELQNFTAESRDFQWIAQIGCANDNWIQETQRWGDLYRNVGKGTFRSRFLHAANRLLHSQPFSTLGFILDVPVHQPLIGCANVVTVLRVDNKDRVPLSAGVWRNISEMEHQLYLQTLVATESTRLAFLPMDYYNCKRFVTAAVRFREVLDRPLTDGFYAGYLVVHVDSAGPMIMLPEGHRILPPLSLVTEAPPTINQWRWLQGLNERRRRTGTFGLDVPSGATPLHHLTFEQRFARSIDELERATGIPVTSFYDTELAILDEGQRVRAFFAVHLLRPQEVTYAGPTLSPRPPQGEVPMILKHSAVVEDNHLRLYWPKLFPSMSDERTSLFTRAYSTAQPFAIDEVFRLQHECAAAFYCDVDKFCSLISWLRPIVSWAITDGRPLVERHGGDPVDVAMRSVEDAVDVAMSNVSASQDVNVMTMKSLLFESVTKQHLSWSTLLSQLRERDRVVAAGYAGRYVPTAPPPAVRQLVLRTQDELGPGEDDDDDNPRPPTVYEVPCNLTELVFKDAEAQQAERYFAMQEIVNDIVDEACIYSIDVGHVRDVGQLVCDMISVVEATEDLVDGAALLTLKDETIEKAWDEREKFQRHWLEVFQSDAAGSNRSRGLLHTLPTPRPEEEEDFNDPLGAPLFYDGSPHTITSLSDGIRVCFAKATNSCEQLQQLMRVCNSAVEALELIQCVQQYSGCVARRDALLGTAQNFEPSDQVQSGARHEAAPQRGQGAGVTIVAKDFQEYFVPPVNALRSIVLSNVSGSVRFPSISSSALEVFAQHVRTPDLATPQALEQLLASNNDLRSAEELLDMSIQLKAPLIALRAVTALFGTKRGAVVFFDLKAAQRIKALLEKGFLFEYSIKDWMHLEALGGAPIASAIDVLWWIRYVKEAASLESGRVSHDDAYVDHEGSWKQVYAETRVRVFLLYGVHAISADEVTLWTESIGRYVEYLTFRETAISDAEVEVMVSCCPNLKSLDLSFTQITSRSIKHLLQCRYIAECSVSGCNLSTNDHDTIRRHCADNRRREEGR